MWQTYLTFTVVVLLKHYSTQLTSQLVYFAKCVQVTHVYIKVVKVTSMSNYIYKYFYSISVHNLNINSVIVQWGYQTTIYASYRRAYLCTSYNKKRPQITPQSVISHYRLVANLSAGGGSATVRTLVCMYCMTTVG